MFSDAILQDTKAQPTENKPALLSGFQCNKQKKKKPSSASLCKMLLFVETELTACEHFAIRTSVVIIYDVFVCEVWALISGKSPAVLDEL